MEHWQVKEGPLCPWGVTGMLSHRKTYLKGVKMSPSEMWAECELRLGQFECLLGIALTIREGSPEVRWG